MADTQLTDRAVDPPGEPERVTLEKYLELLDDGGYEVIDGELTPMTPQELESSRIAHDLYNSLHSHVSQRKLGRIWMETTVGFEVEPGGRWLRGSMVPRCLYERRTRKTAA